MVVDVATRSLRQQVDLELPADLRVAWPGQVAVADSHLLLGLQPLSAIDAVRSTHLAVVDTSSWEVLAVTPTKPFWSFSPSASDNAWVFTLEQNAQGGELAALEPIGGVRLQVVDNLQGVPFAVTSGPAP
jgi:hypothetical protein